jgi:large subunit ribosomal protein L21e
MAKASRGLRAGTRKSLKKGLRDKFKPNDYLREFAPGQKALIHPDPASQKGMPHIRFKGKVGEVLERRGASYVVRVMLGDKPMKVISRPEHLRPLGK